MILRKPYAFFIKYFKLINLIMAIFMGGSIYCTLKIGNYLSSYINNYSEASANFDLGNYINMYSFLIVLLVIITNVIILSVLIVKKKPIKMYVINIIIYVIILVLYFVDYSTLHNIYSQILEASISRALRDINYIALATQAVICLFALIRATGFDIKQFDFGKDLEQLNIDAEDNEEVEVALELDRNKVNRSIRSNIRNLNYFYKEHKLVINVVVAVLFILIIFLVVLNKTIYVDNYKEGQTISASNYGIVVKDSYLVTTDSTGNEIVDDEVLVVVKLDVKKYSETAKTTLNTGLITLRVGNDSYGQTTSYTTKLEDIGTSYVDQELDTEYTSYLLTFKIPNEDKNKTLKLKINDNVSYIRGQIGALNNYVTLDPQDLTEKQSGQTVSMGETLSFQGSVLGDSLLTLNKIDIANEFKVSYNFCKNSSECSTSYEYVTPTATGNYAKTLLRIDGTFELDETANLENMGNIYYFLNEFGTIYYKVDNTWYYHRISSQRVKANKTSETGITYIEVNRNVLNASEIYFVFNVRNYTYKYTIK